MKSPIAAVCSACAGGSRSRLFVPPQLAEGGVWEGIVDTARPTGTRLVRRRGVNLTAHSLILLRWVPAPDQSRVRSGP